MKIKNEKNARKYATKILTKRYGKHVINSISHIINTNVWTIQAHAKELEIILNLDAKTGKMIGEPLTQRNVNVSIIEEPVRISEKVFREMRYESHKTHWGWLIATVCLTVFGSILSAFFDPFVGITISLIFGALSIVYGRYAFTQLIETDR